MGAAVLHVLALCALLACCAAWKAPDGEPPLSPHEILIRVIRLNNGTVDLEVKDIPGKGRGLVAFRDMKKNQIAVHLPRPMAFQLAPVSKALEESAEALLEPKHENVAPWFEIYWDSLPQRDEFLWRRQPFPVDKLALLQDEALASNLTKALQYMRKYFQRAMTVKGTFDDFAEATALVNTYAFNQFHDDQGVHIVRTMLPLIDLANHAAPGEATLGIMQGSDMNFYAYTACDVAEGEELTLPYSRPALRPDQALFHYGFLPAGVDPAQATELRLAALDLPEGSLHDTPIFSEDYLPLGRLQTQAELDRLSARLAAFPTTVAEDAELLGGLEDELERLFVAYRLQRKRALHAAHERLAVALEEDAALAELESLEAAAEEAELELELELGEAGGEPEGAEEL